MTNTAFADTIQVINQYFKPIANASVNIQSVQDNQKTYIYTSDEKGFVFTDFEINSYYIGKNEIKSVYPNPFNNEVLIWYTAEKYEKAVFSVYDLSGRKIFFKDLGNVYPGDNFYTWNCNETNDREINNGIYIAEIKSSSFQTSKLIVKQNGLTYQSPVIPDTVNSNEHYYLESFKVSIESSGYGTLMIDNYYFGEKTFHYFVLPQQIAVPFTTSRRYFYRWNGTGYDSIFLKGINLGVSIPNTLPGELAATREQYREWIGQIADIGFNNIRVYTLHFPHFYEELYNYNVTHPENPVYLFQGVWLDETESDGTDLYEQTTEFGNEIELVVDAMHGNVNVPVRYGKAYGEFETDISPWIIGYIIGREVHPFTIQKTNYSHLGDNAYSGAKLSLPDGSPSEYWITMHLDNLLTYEQNNYNVERPVSFSSWPTLDPLEHPTELALYSSEDIVSIDLANIEKTDAPAGLFASYHAYPYFPDFINDEPLYMDYSDSYGKNSYLGYLDDLKLHYDKMPLLIAEFGIPTSWGNAHFSNSGMHHGAITEEEQGNYIIRMFNNMYDVKCAGGQVFAWIDEWFKNSWITMYFDSEPQRRPFWNNMLNPEQNFGLISFQETGEKNVKTENITSNDSFDKIELSNDNTYFYTDITLKNPFSASDKIFIAFDTYDKNLGESRLPNGQTIENRAEFCLEMSDTSATFYVTQAYDLFAIWHKEAKNQQLFHSIATDGEPWYIFRIKNNWGSNAVHYPGMLRINEDNILNSVSINGAEIKIRIPWGMLQFTDPSKMEVMNDERSTPQRETRVSDGICLTIFCNSTKYTTGRHTWKTWDKVSVVEKEKRSVPIIKSGIKNIGF